VNGAHGTDRAGGAAQPAGSLPHSGARPGGGAPAGASRSGRARACGSASVDRAPPGAQVRADRAAAGGGDPRDGGSPAGRAGGRGRRNGLATASLVLGVVGFSLVTIVPSMVCGILGLRRAGAPGSPALDPPAPGSSTPGLSTAGSSALGVQAPASRGPSMRAVGRVRCWAGIACCLLWAGAGGYLLPHLIRAADPGCTGYKGPALAAYNKVIDDLDGDRPSALPGDINGAVSALNAAALRSRDTTAARDLNRLVSGLRAVLGDVRAKRLVRAPELAALNKDTAGADAACGTLRW
jgi:hypothetical protein